MHEVLYTKWRPMSFDDVIAQRHITDTLKKQVISGHTAHAYLFTGSRGTGKTTCARILAKAVNCLSPENGNPCRKCDICVDADKFALPDILEIDAASNNGVDDIRELRDGAVFTPERCRCKIYIIDEVHMLSISAFNALLKILEEPPGYVKFILATTEVHKIPATILSRCQRFDFKRIKPQDIAERLKYVAENEDFTLTEDAALLIAKLADGGMRDALSLLERCAALSDNIDEEAVSSCAGVSGNEAVYELLEALVDLKITAVLEIIAQQYYMSKDMQRLCSEIILKLRNIMLLKASAGDTSLLECMPNETDKIRLLSEKLSLEKVLSMLDLLQSCAERLAKAANKRLELEMSMIKLCKADSVGKAKANEPVMSSELSERLEQLEKQLECRSVQTAAAEPPPNLPQEQQVDFSKLRPEDFRKLAQWNEIIEKLYEISPSVAGSLAGSAAFENGNVLLIRARNTFFLELLRQKENAAALGEVAFNVTGKHYVIRGKADKTSRPDERRAMKLIEKANSAGVETQIITKKESTE